MFGKKQSHKLDFIFLDSLNLFLAPLGGGAGAYIAYYFASTQHWQASQIGLLLSIMAISLAITQIPAGLIIDRVRRKNLVMAVALGVIAASWLAILIFPTQSVAYLAQAMIGISCAFFGPTLAAISLNLVGHDGLGLRLGRSGVFSHIGNMVAAVSIGLCTAYLSGQAIVGLLVSFAFLAAVSALAISQRPVTKKLDSAPTEDKGFHPLFVGIAGLFSTAESRIFTVAALLYTNANASMLPLMVQLISRQGAHAASVQLPSSLLLTEFVMIPVCYIASRLLSLGRRPLLTVSFIFLVLRGIGFTLIKTPALMVAMQILDGISAGIFGLLVTTVVADFCRHNDRFSSTLAAIYMLLTLANGISEFSSGMMASSLGFTVTFGILTAIAFAGLIIIVGFLPEASKAAENPNALPAPSKT